MQTDETLTFLKPKCVSGKVSMASKGIVVKHDKLSSERIPTVFFFSVVAFVITAKPYDLETCMYGLTEGTGLRNPFLLSFLIDAVEPAASWFIF